MAGLALDPWQQLVLRGALGERADGRWSAFEIGLICPRQNGKGGILEARELAGLYLLGEQFLVHSAHLFDTSLEAFRRLLSRIEWCSDLSRRVKRVLRSHGEEGIELTTGQRIRFRTRTGGGGRGFSGDLLVLDEAMFLRETAHGALLPTLSARPNPQVWYAGSAVDQDVHEHGMVFSRLRQRGHRRDDPALAFFEWSAPDDADAEDESAWALANPGLGIRIARTHIRRERRSMDSRTFAVERLGVGDWPDPDAAGQGPVPLELWEARASGPSDSVGAVRFAFDVTPARTAAAIAVAFKRPDGRRHVEIVEHRLGTGWTIERILELLARNETVGPIVCDRASPAAALMAALADAGVQVEAIGPREHAEACGQIFDGISQDTVRHTGTPELAAAIKGAAQRPLGDAWAWSRRSSAVDIAPLVASTLALWGLARATDIAQNVW